MSEPMGHVASRGRLDVGSLLTIDVPSELRKVPGGTRDGLWQVPTELVRWILRAGASSVEVRVGRGLVEVRGEGAELPADILGDLAELLDEAAPLQARHDALLRLESRQAWELAGLASVPRRELSIEGRGHTHRCLTQRRRSTPKVETIPPGSWRGTRILLRGAPLDTRRSRRWLERACRFTPVPITLEGHALASGFERSLAEVSLEPELVGRLSLSREGETARVWLLSSGIVTAHATLPGLPGLEAAVEMTGLVGGGAGPGALREAIGPKLRTLESRAVELLLALATRVPQLSRADATRVRVTLLAATRRRLRTRELLAAPAFPTVRSGTPRGGVHWHSLLELGQAASASESHQLRLSALYPDQDPASFNLPERPVFVLDASERAALARILGIRFRPPPRRAGAEAFWSRVRNRIAAAAAGVGSRLSSALSAGRPQPLSPDRLSLSERRLLEALAGRLRKTAPEELGLCEGDGPAVVRLGRKRRLFSRLSPELTGALRALERSSTWIYPVTLALLGPDARPSSGDRSRWRGRASAPGQSGPQVPR